MYLRKQCCKADPDTKLTAVKDKPTYLCNKLHPIVLAFFLSAALLSLMHQYVLLLPALCFTWELLVGDTMLCHPSWVTVCPGIQIGLSCSLSDLLETIQLTRWIFAYCSCKILTNASMSTLKQGNNNR